jgi:hypothetical protein
MSTIINARALRRGRTLGLAALALAGLTAGLALATSGAASALPLCGGNQNVQTAPVTCTNSRTIDGTTFTVVLDVTAGGTVTASYTLDAPRSVDTPIRVRSHRGISSDPRTLETSGVIPAGATSASLSTSLNCGQIDVKAVFTGNGDSRGRITAPFVTMANDCQSAPTTTTTSPTTAATTAPTTPTTSPTTPAPTGATSTPSSVSPTSAGASTTAASSSGALPTTGTGTGLLVVSALLVLAGVVLITKSRGSDAVPQ